MDKYKKKESMECLIDNLTRTAIAAYKEKMSTIKAGEHENNEKVPVCPFDIPPYSEMVRDEKRLEKLASSPVGRYCIEKCGLSSEQCRYASAREILARRAMALAH